MSTCEPPPPGDPTRLRPAFARVAAFAGVLWAIRLAESVGGLDLASLGILPRRPEGLPGIFLAPLIHGSWAHLVANTGPVLVLGTAVLYGYPRSARIVLPAVYLGAGLGVWLFARPAYHIGASGLTSGVMVFVFVIGVLRWERAAIALAMIVFFLYGGMLAGLVPGDPTVSHESHLAGAVIGGVLAFFLRRRDPPRPRRRYSWEDDEHGEDDDGAGGPLGAAGVRAGRARPPDLR